MNFSAMLEKMAWEPSNIKNDIEKVDRILTSLRMFLSNDASLPNINGKYQSFWKCVAQHNLFICVCVLKRAEKFCGKDDACTSVGLSVVTDELQRFTLDDEQEIIWKLLSEIELRQNLHIVEYTKYLLNIGRLRKALKYLENTADFDTCVAFYMASVSISDMGFRRAVFQNIMSLNWMIDVSVIENKSLVSTVIARNLQFNDIPVLLNIITLYDRIQISDFWSKTLPEWKKYLITQYQPISMMLYEKLLQSENVSMEDKLNELYDFAVSSSKKTGNCINGYLYFSYAVTESPMQYDTYINNLKFILSSTCEQASGDAPSKNGVDTPEDAFSESSTRGLNHLLVDKPFISLIRNNPDKVLDYVRTIGEISLYHISKSLTYKKSVTWINNSHPLEEYRLFLVDFAERHTPDESIELYMNSPMKSVIDFSYLLRLLYQPKEGWISIADALKGYIFRGKLVRTATDDKYTAYRVTLSNACSSYCFPLHHSWIKYHIDELEANFAVGEPVYFEIMSVNSKGMIFAHNLTQIPQTAKVIQEGPLQTRVFRNMQQVIAGSFVPMGKNTLEDVRLFVMAMICNDHGKILVKCDKEGNKTVESLPSLPVSNCEGTDSTLKRLLKYYIGVNKELFFAPCGIRHICIDRAKRIMFFIYKIQLSDLGEKQNAFTFKKSMNWQKITTYRENATDEISKSVLWALDQSWSEDTISLENTEKPL